jgi:hypothetical protein
MATLVLSANDLLDAHLMIRVLMPHVRNAYNVLADGGVLNPAPDPGLAMYETAPDTILSSGLTELHYALEATPPWVRPASSVANPVFDSTQLGRFQTAFTAFAQYLDYGGTIPTFTLSSANTQDAYLLAQVILPTVLRMAALGVPPVPSLEHPAVTSTEVARFQTAALQFG